jgi:hypothetical protein
VSLAGWGLSAVGQLNRTGYVLFFVFAALVFFACQKSSGLLAGWKLPTNTQFRRRFRRLFPGAFALLAFLILLGGTLYPPTNYTGLNYRVSRVLQWLAHEQWWWIHTPIYRMNDRACGAEWFLAPVLLFTKSDRALFLINYLPYLLLPGLIFSVFTRLGVVSRVAWHWMWLLPTGYIFLLQAGSIANDTFPTVYALAAFDFALRARVSGRVSDLWYSIVAAALLTGAKAGNLPLLLPWGLIVLTLVPLAKRQTPVTLMVLAVAALISFLPIAVLNEIYCHDWTGAKIEQANMVAKSPWIAILGNAYQLLQNNFAPPILPVAGWWNAHAPSILPHFFVTATAANFTSGYLVVGELPTEDWTGIGFGLSVLLLVSVVGGLCIRAKPVRQNSIVSSSLNRRVKYGIWIALFAYCMTSGMENAVRIIAPYYPLIVLTLVAGPAQAIVVRRRWWRALACGTLVLALVVLVLAPDRPLWPAQTVLDSWSSGHPDSSLARRARQVYSVYRGRNDALAGVRELLPPGLKAVGFVGNIDDCDISLWRPFGSRRVEHFLVTDPPELLRSRVQYVAVGGYN